MLRLIFTLATFVALLGALPGCGAGAITTQAQAARLVGRALAGVGVAIDDARDADLGTCGALPAPAERLACDDAGMTRWAPAVASYNLTRAGLDAWVGGLSLMVLSETEDADALAYLLPIALQFLELYQELQFALEPFEEIDLPEIPNLSVLLGGGTP